MSELEKIGCFHVASFWDSHFWIMFQFLSSLFKKHAITWSAAVNQEAVVVGQITYLPLPFPLLFAILKFS